jgi:hypothetical protein
MDYDVSISFLYALSINHFYILAFKSEEGSFSRFMRAEIYPSYKIL